MTSIKLKDFYHHVRFEERWFCVRNGNFEHIKHADRTTFIFFLWLSCQLLDYGRPLSGFHSHSQLDTSQSVGLHWTSDQPDVQSSTWQHTTLTTDTHAPDRIRTRSPSKQTAADPRLRPRGHLDWPTSNVHWRNISHNLIFWYCSSSAWCKFNLSDQLNVHWNIKTTGTQCSICFGTSWVPSSETLFGLKSCLSNWSAM